MSTTIISCNFLAGQATVSPYYTSGSDAFVQLVCTENLGLKVTEVGPFKQIEDVPETALDTRVANIRIPAGHWLVLTRSIVLETLEVLLRRISGGAEELPSLTALVETQGFNISESTPLGLVRNGLNRSMFYRLTVRSSLVKNVDTFYVRSGTDKIYPVSGSFTLDLVLPGGGKLELLGLTGDFSGTYDLFVEQ